MAVATFRFVLLNIYVQWRSQEKNFRGATVKIFFFLRGAFIILKGDKLIFFSKTIGKTKKFPNLRGVADPLVLH